MKKKIRIINNYQPKIMIMNYTEEELFDFIRFEYSYPFSGWNFSHINTRIVSSTLPWSYTSKILLRLRTTKIERFLDMGTGGGEFLSDNFQPFPKNSFATEAYPPNVPIARKRLESLGIKVIQVEEDGKLPFDDDYFDLIINQHEFYSDQEVFRILKPGGEFITKQVHQKNDLDLANLLKLPIDDEPWNVELASQSLVNAGFEIIEKYESDMEVRVFDVGAIAYLLKIAPWGIPSFNLEEHIERLLPLQKMIEKEGYIKLNNPRFMIIAKK